MISNNTDEIKYIKDGVFIQNSAYSHIGISKNINKKISTNVDPCREDITEKSTDSIYFKLAKNLNTYQREVCIKIYIQIELMIKNCACISAPAIEYQKLNDKYNVGLCHTKKQLDCKTKQIDLSKSLNINYQDCPLECTKITYSTNINAGSYPSAAYCDLLQTQEDAIKKFIIPPTSPIDMSDRETANFMYSSSFLIFKVFYQKDSYQYIESSLQIESMSLLGSIG